MHASIHHAAFVVQGVDPKLSATAPIMSPSAKKRIQDAEKRIAEAMKKASGVEAAAKVPKLSDLSSPPAAGGGDGKPSVNSPAAGGDDRASLKIEIKPPPAADDGASLKIEIKPPPAAGGDDAGQP